MRLTRLRLLRVVLLILLALGVLALPALASAKSTHQRKVDEELAAVAAAADPGTPLHVIAYAGPAGLQKTEQQGNGKVEHHLRLIDAESMIVTPEQLEELAADADVKYITLDAPVTPTAAGTPLSLSLLASLYPTIDGTSAAWSQGYTGAGVGIAVVDSGVTATADFGGRLTQVQLPGQTSIADTYGHGTFVAGVAGGLGADGRYAGIAPRAAIYAVNVNDASGVYTSNVILGLDWVDANRLAYNIRVVNISLSETTTSSYLSSPLDAAVERLWSHGVVVVVSAGNRGPGTMQYAPANDPFAIAVGAVDNGGTIATGDDTIASFSSSGTTPDGFSKPDLLAPGRQIASVLPGPTALGQQAPLANLILGGYATMSGTSFAAPQVAGAAALLLQKHPEWTPDQVKWLLAQTGRSASGGSGRVLDIGAAIGFSGTVDDANQGVAPAPQTASTSDATATANTNSWNTNSWNTNSWNTNSWNTNSWNTFAWE
jgi:serine protease AprX